MSHRKPTKPTSSHSRQYWFSRPILDLRCSLPPQIAKKASEVHNTTFSYPKNTSLLSKCDPCKIEIFDWCSSHQIGHAWTFQQRQNSKHHRWKDFAYLCSFSISCHSGCTPVAIRLKLHKSHGKHTNSHQHRLIQDNIIFQASQFWIDIAHKRIKSHRQAFVWSQHYIFLSENAPHYLSRNSPIAKLQDSGWRHFPITRPHMHQTEGKRQNSKHHRRKYLTYL